MVFLFTAMHECSHATAFRSRWLNLAVGTGAGMLLLISPRWFFHFHQDHHRFTQDPARDPELATPKPATLAGYAWYLSGLPFWYGNLKVLVGNAMARRRDPYVPSACRAAVVREARLMLLAHTVMLTWLAITGLLVSTPSAAAARRATFSAGLSSCRTCGLRGEERQYAGEYANASDHRAGPLPFPGICRSTPSITAFRQCRFTRCRACTGS